MTTIDAGHVRSVEAEHVLQVYKRIPLVLVRGEGSWLFDADGTRYLDLLSGIGVASLGHAHQGLAQAISAQAAELIHTSNLFFHPLQGDVAAKLTAMSGLDRVFFSNSGTEAVEACLKFARRYWYTQGERAAEQDRGIRAVVSRSDVRFPLCDVGRGLPRAVRAAGSRRHLRVSR